MREIVSINLGQCGIQLAGQFWECLAKYIAHESTYDSINSVKNELINRFYSESSNTTGDGLLDNYIARVVLVDTEIGAVNDVIRDKKATKIDSTNIITGTEATGNNWATAYESYGPKYKEALEDMLRAQVEQCDSLQCFNTNFSLSGGTGSGLGSYLLELLTNDYPKVTRLSNVITQKNDATVATYNTILCLNTLQRYSNLVICYSNESILNIRYNNTNNFSGPGPDECNKYFGPINESINDFIVPVLTTLGNSNYISSHIDTLVNNLTPFPELNYCSAGVSSLGFQEVKSDLTVDQIFWQAMQNNTILSPNAGIKSHSLGIAFFGATKFSNKEVSMQATRLAFKNEMLSYNRNGIKLFLKSSAHKMRLNDRLCVIDNNCSIHLYLENVIATFQKLYKKKAFLHHFKDIIDDSQFQQVNENIIEIAKTYDQMEKNLFTTPKHLNYKTLMSLGNTIDDVENVNSENTDKRCNLHVKMHAKLSNGMKLWCNEPKHISKLANCKSGKHWWQLCATPLV